MKEFLILFGSVFLLDALFGDPRSAFHPVALFGRAALAVEAFCRRIFGNGIVSGLTGWLILTLPPALGAGAVVLAAGRWNGWFGTGAAVLICYFTVALRSLSDHAERIRRPLLRGDLPGARHALSMIVSRDTESLPESEIVRGAVESLGENLIDGVTSAYFWMGAGFLAAGCPGAAACAVFLRAVNTLDACWGYRNDRYLLFGRIAARMDDAVHLIPARLTLFAIALAAPFAGGNPLEALRKGIRHRKDHPSPNSGYGMAGFAGALKIRLGGPTVYHGEVEPYPCWGDGRPLLNAGDLKRAEILAWVSCLFFLLILGAGVFLFLSFR